MNAWIVAVFLALSAAMPGGAAGRPEMYYTDASHGRSLAKDPDVEWFQGRYLMYYSVNRGRDGWAVGIAESGDLVHWTKVGEVLPAGDCESKGLAAPAAMVREGKLHLFYQTYGNGRNDAICHAVSEDGIHSPATRRTPSSDRRATGIAAGPSMPR